MFKCVLISLLEIKSFAPLENESVLFWVRVNFKGGGSQVLQNFEGAAHKGGGLTDSELFGGLR